MWDDEDGIDMTQDREKRQIFLNDVMNCQESIEVGGGNFCGNRATVSLGHCGMDLNMYKANSLVYRMQCNFFFLSSLHRFL